jgi:hypothetical protein
VFALHAYKIHLEIHQLQIVLAMKIIMIMDQQFVNVGIQIKIILLSYFQYKIYKNKVII